jgi:hypothetical protein
VNDDRPWHKRCADAVRGLRTLITAAALIGLGLADYYDTVNVKPVLDQLFGADQSAKLMIFLPIIFGTLRFVTSGKVRWFKKDQEPF